MSFEEVLPYLKKSESYPSEVIAKHGSKYFGSDGPIKIRQYNYTDSDLHRIIFEAGCLEAWMPSITANTSALEKPTELSIAVYV